MIFLSSVLNMIKWILLFLAAYFIFVMTVVRLIRHFYQFPIPSIFAPLIDNPIRRKIQSPTVIAQWMGVKDCMSILEIGPGSGTFTFEVAEHVGDDGRVYAIDIQESIVTALGGKAEKLGVDNVSVRQASAYELPYPDRYFDRVFMVTVLGEIPDKRKSLLEIKRVLKDEGLLAIGEFLPDPDYPRKSTVTGWCEESGFELNEQFGNWLHYLLTFVKSQ
ncbi:class I SAM-dependent methyltransferase [Chloroflexota bacterium]